MHIVIGHSDMLSPGVITVPDDDPDSIYEDAPDEFSTSELTDRPQFRNERFKLDYSSILDKSNKTYRDDYEIETAETGSASTSKPAKVTIKKRALFTNPAKNKRQRYQGSVTSLLQLSESEDDEGNCIFSSFVSLITYVNNFDHLLCKLDEHSESSVDDDDDDGDDDGKTKSRD